MLNVYVSVTPFSYFFLKLFFTLFKVLCLQNTL